MNVLFRADSKRTLALESKSHVLLFRYIKETKKCAIELISKDSFISTPYKQLSRSKPHGFLGLIEMNNDIFLCVITSKRQVAEPLPNEQINKINDVEFYSLTNDVWDFLDLNSNGYPHNETEETQSANYTPRIPQHPCWELRKFLTDGSFFYSSDFDLTSTLQNRGVNINGKERLSVDNFHTDYMWNNFMMEGIIQFRNNLSEREKKILDYCHFLTTVIRGYSETLTTVIDGKTCEMTIISKQSWKRAGTRFNVRGVDDDGNVANFVETELILDDGLQIFSFTQIRGSIPIFWEQDTALISPKVQITRSFEATQPTFKKHFENLNGKYGPIHIVNLLSKTRSSEIELSETYNKHYKYLKKKTPDSVFFTNFDFHVETAKTYADASRLLPHLRESFEDFDYFLYDLKSKSILMEQKGTFRTNCLDCLDRTNVIQQVISLAALLQYLKSKKIRDLSNVKSKHSTLWANHGDQISQIYTGTNALKSSFSRSGKMGFAGALSDATKSISRIYINNFVDKGKQQITDTLLGKISNQNIVEIYDPITEYLTDELKNYESKFTTFDNIKIFTGTFNLAGANENKNLSNWLFPDEGFNPDIFVIGFQEVVELNASMILKNDGSVGQYWTKEVERTIKANTNDEYVLLRSEFMSSILLLLFVKSKHVPKITEVEGKSKKTGLVGMAGNKGTVAIRLNISSTTFCFVNSHLASGLNSIEDRNNDFISSWNGIRFSRNRYIEHHDNIIWLGDLNYRIAYPNESARSLINKNELSKLLEKDQLVYQMKRIKEFKIFKESEIEFPPTYKFDKYSDEYDTSEKQRVPAWTDRILFKGKNLNSITYDYISMIKFSDHRPVYNIFNSEIKIIDEDIKDDISNNIKKNYKSNTKNKNNLIELNDASSSTASSIDSIPPLISNRRNIPSSATANLIDFDSSVSSVSPPLPKRPVPPVYNPLETKNMLIPGLTPSNVEKSIELSMKLNTDNSSSNSIIDSAKSSSVHSFSVMSPTVSRSGTPVKNNIVPPAPPPRKIVPTVNNISSNTDHQKIAPIVPSKPKNLNNLYADSTSITNEKKDTVSTPSPEPSQTQSWSVMTPTKKLG